MEAEVRSIVITTDREQNVTYIVRYKYQILRNNTPININLNALDNLAFNKRSLKNSSYLDRTMRPPPHDLLHLLKRDQRDTSQFRTVKQNETFITPGIISAYISTHFVFSALTLHKYQLISEITVEQVASRTTHQAFRPPAAINGKFVIDRYA